MSNPLYTVAMDVLRQRMRKHLPGAAQAEAPEASAEPEMDDEAKAKLAAYYEAQTSDAPKD